MVRYGLGANSYLMWADEGTPYTVASPINKNFGLLTEDVKPPNGNPKTPLPTIGARRAPHAYGSDPKDFSFDIPFHVQHKDAPFHAALGAKTTSSVAESSGGAGDAYTKTLFTEASVLPTISIEHGSADLALIQRFAGTKASLHLKSSKGESVKANLGVVAATETHLTGSPATAALQTPSLPTNEPFRFSHIQSVSLFAAGTVLTTRTLVKAVATLDSFDFGWNPALEAVPHGGTGRQNYSVVEGDAPGLYDMKLGVTAADTDFFTRAADNQVEVDVEVALARTVVTPPGTLTDALIVRLQNCTVLDGGTDMPAAGRIRTEVALGPLNTQIEMRTPA